MMNEKRRDHKKKGFTLIEIIVALIIIMVIGAIALPKYFIAVEKSYVTQARKFQLDIYGADKRYALYNSDIFAADPKDLDIEATVPEGYTWLPLAAVSATGSTVIISRLQRQKPSPDDYIVNLWVDGTISCESPGSTICAKLGFF